MENDNHEIYGNPRNTGRRGLQVEAKTKSLLWPHSIGIRGPHSSNTKKGAKTSNSGVERNVIRYNCTALHCMILHCIVLRCILLYCIAMHCIAWYCIVLISCLLLSSLLFSSILGCVLPLQEVALRRNPPTFSVLCCPCPYRSLLPHNVISPMMCWFSN